MKHLSPYKRILEQTRLKVSPEQEIEKKFLKAGLFGKFDLCQEMVDNGFDVNKELASSGFESWTPLHVAAHHAKPGFIEFLTRNGANVNAEDDMGYTPLWEVTETTNKSTTQLSESIKALVKAGADVNKPHPNSKETILNRYTKATRGFSEFDIRNEYLVDVIKTLLEAGADTNVKDKTGKMPAEYIRDYTRGPYVRKAQTHDGRTTFPARMIMLFLNAGVPIETYFDDIDGLLKYFDNDVSWWETNVPAYLRRMQRSMDLFGED